MKAPISVPLPPDGLMDTDAVCTVYYRLPDSGSFTALRSASPPLSYPDLPEAGAGEGFFIAPFAPSADTPCVLVRPDVVQTFAVRSEWFPDVSHPLPRHSPDASYISSFVKLHKLLDDCVIRKVVLSRQELVRAEVEADPLLLFLRACSLYPECYVTYFNTPQTGAWLMATPETLLRRTDDGWRTMALAGTMVSDAAGNPPSVEDFGEKNCREQQFVTDYIRQVLVPFVDEMQVGRTSVSRMGGTLCHLRTDIRFRASCGPLPLLRALHPTPAVCGLPTVEARRAIIEAEVAPRRYYAGFSGPMGLGDEDAFFVTLRCLEFTTGGARLYAGGGLLKESVLEKEWEETCRKMDAARRLLG